MSALERFLTLTGSLVTDFRPFVHHLYTNSLALNSVHFTNSQDKTLDAKPDTSSDKENKSDQTAANTGETNGEEAAKDATKLGLATSSIFSDNSFLH